LKARIVEEEKVSIAKYWLCKHATVDELLEKKHAAIEQLLEAIFSMRSEDRNRAAVSG
jgi:hypothetical protein